MTPAPETRGLLAENIVHFARALRAAGVRLGPAQVQGAIEAVAAAGFSRRGDFYHTLRATLVNRPEHLEVFHQVFNLFWRDPAFLERMMQLMSPLLRQDRERDDAAARRRAEEALAPPPGSDRDGDSPPREEVELSATLTVSGREVDRAQDFEQMSAAELAEAERALASLRLPLPALPGRRLRPAGRGRPDLRATLRRAMRRGGEIDRVALRRPVSRLPDLVVLCDISGSMSVYSRMLLRFLHAVGADPHRRWGRLHAFTFGTRLTNISRAMVLRDPDAALAAAGAMARDWEGGTRIGAALAQFNRVWARRVLPRGAVVVLITDGLERDDAARLAAEAERLHLSCRRLLWLNPLLRWDGFQPRAAGVRALLPHVDHFAACHSLDSLDSLARVLSESALPSASTRVLMHKGIA